MPSYANNGIFVVSRLLNKKNAYVFQFVSQILYAKRCDIVFRVYVNYVIIWSMMCNSRLVSSLRNTRFGYNVVFLQYILQWF